MKLTPGNLLREFVRTTVSLYYPNVVVTGRERIPASGPVLFVANHANSLIDPVIIGIATRRPIRFMAKAPLFDEPVIGPLMKALGMLPAYRGVDSRAQVAKNAETLAAAADQLARGEAVGIFPEGKSHDELKVDQVKTGAARMALQAHAKGAKDLVIVPIGINYQRKEQFRSSVWVQVGQPIDLQSWLDSRPQSKTSAPADAPKDSEGAKEDRVAMRDLTHEIDDRLKKVVIHLASGEWEPFLRDLEILLPDGDRRAVDPINALRQRKRIADAINHFLERDKKRALRAAVAVERHRRDLAAEGLEVRSLAVRYERLSLWSRLLSRTCGIVLGFVPVALGMVHHFLPFVITRLLAARYEAQGRMTRSLTRLGLGLPIYIAWYALVWWWMYGYFRPGVATIWAVCMVPAGVFALSYTRTLKIVASDWWHEIRTVSMRDKLLRWREQQRELGVMLSELERSYSVEYPPEPDKSTRYSWHRRATFAAATAIALLLGVLVSAWMRVQTRPEILPELADGGPQLQKLSTQTLTGLLDSDETLLLQVTQNVNRLEKEAQQIKAEFDSGKRSFLRQEDDDTIRRLMLYYLTQRSELMRLLWHYQGHARITDERLRNRAFLLDLTSGAVLFDLSSRFVAMFESSPEAVRKLNEPEPRWDIPPKIFDTVRHNLSQQGNRDLLENAYVEYGQRSASFQRLGLMDTSPYKEFHGAIHQAAMRGLKGAPPVQSEAAAVTKEAGRMGKSAIYWGQSMVSTWVGDTRVRRPREGKALIQPKQLADMRQRVQPGDILIERQNWFLSRAFMPGYWAHAALYVGSPEDLKRMGLADDPRIAAHWQAFVQRDEEGHEHVILEAVPRGVRMTTLEHCIGIADSAAVLRPKVNRAQMHDAIAQAFSHLGKPYDFEFDFFSTDKLVCTELVYRCYDGAVHFDLVNVMGRMTLPPTELVRMHVNGQAQGHSQFELVMFLDGLESRGMAVEEGEPEFLKTVDRPSMTWLQKK